MTKVKMIASVDLIHACKAKGKMILKPKIVNAQPYSARLGNCNITRLFYDTILENEAFCSRIGL